MMLSLLTLELLLIVTFGGLSFFAEIVNRLMVSWPSWELVAPRECALLWLIFGER
jgi:hypothetical protein